MKTELNVIKSHLFVKWQCWTAYMWKTELMLLFHRPSLLQLFEGHLAALALVLAAQLGSTNMKPNPQRKYKGLPCVFRCSLVLSLTCSLSEHFPALTHPSSFLGQAQSQPGLWTSSARNPPNSSTVRKLQRERTNARARLGFIGKWCVI